MSELIFGNTGTKDEYINIDMEQSLFNDLKKIIPKFRDHLNAAMKNDESIFVYLGERNNHIVYGYHAKLVTDGRGGNYGHYIAIPSEASCFSLNDAHFITEADFFKFASTRDISESRRFHLAPKETLVTENAQKEIIHELLCRFSQDNFNNTSISFQLPDGQDYIGNALYVLDGILGYLPYGLRSKITFMSKVDTPNRIPNEIQIVACTDSQGMKNIVDLTRTTGYVEGGRFDKYITAVFSRSEQDRANHFKWLYKNIESIAQQQDGNICSEIYVQNLQILEFRHIQDIMGILDFVFGGNIDVVMMYPRYSKIVAECLANQKESLLQYLSHKINEINHPNTIKSLYLDAKIVSDLIGADFNEMIALFRSRVANMCVGPQTLEYLDVAYAIDQGAVVDDAFANSVISCYVKNCEDIKKFLDISPQIMEFYRNKSFNSEIIEKELLSKSGDFTDSFSEEDMGIYFQQLDGMKLLNYNRYITRAKVILAEKTSLLDISNTYQNLSKLFRETSLNKQVQNIVDRILYCEEKQVVAKIESYDYSIENGGISEMISPFKELYQGLSLDDKENPIVQQYYSYLDYFEKLYSQQKAKMERELVFQRKKTLNKTESTAENLSIFSDFLKELAHMEKTRDTEIYYAILCEKINETIINSCNYIDLSDFIDQIESIDDFISEQYLSKGTNYTKHILRFSDIYQTVARLLACPNVSSLIDTCQELEFKQRLRSDNRCDMRNLAIIIFAERIQDDKKYNYHRAVKKLRREDTLRQILKKATPDELKYKSEFFKKYIFIGITGGLLIAIIVLAVLRLVVFNSGSEEDGVNFAYIGFFHNYPYLSEAEY